MPSPEAVPPDIPRQAVRPPSRTIAGASAPPASAVLTTTRRAGPLFRDELAASTGLSHATVNRQVVALIDARLLRERPDLVATGAVGRPRTPVEVDPDRFGVLGLHIGVRRTTLAVGDLRGTVLGAVDVPTPRDDPVAAVALLTQRLRRFGARWPVRTVLHVGLVVGGELSADRLRLRHRRLGWGSAPVAEIVDRVAMSDVVVVPQVEAMAVAEALLSPRPLEGTALHVYAREAVGAVLTVDGAVHTPSSGPGTISHLPVGGDVLCHCGRTGCLEASAGDAAVAAAAHRAGIVDEPSIARVLAAAAAGRRGAHELLVERARLLGRGVAIVRDVLNPDHVVLAGQAFTAYRPALPHVSASFAATTVLEPMNLRVTSFGPSVQALAACTAALRPVYADPLGAVRKAVARAGDPERTDPSDPAAR
jgi:predicted NBD/HSP70 family sugar kinase